MPVFVVAQKEALVVGVQCRVQEEADEIEMSHFFEAAICGVDSAADNGEALALDLLAQPVVLSEENLLVKTTSFPKLCPVKEHEHAG